MHEKVERIINIALSGVVLDIQGYLKGYHCAWHVISASIAINEKIENIIIEVIDCDLFIVRAKQIWLRKISEWFSRGRI